jgi:hypothetical protein
MKKSRWIAGLVMCIFISVAMAGSVPASIRKLPTFTIYTLQGKEENLPLSSWSILYFFSPDCFSCVNTLLRLQKEIVEKKGVLFFPICSECDWRNLKDLRESLPPDLEVYFLSPRDRAILGVWDTPSFFLLSPTGKVVQKWEKDVTYEEIARFFPAMGKKKLARHNAKPSCSSGNICE